MGTYRASDGAELYFDDGAQSAGLPLLFVHGWQANGTIWQPAIDALGSRYRTIAVDLRGTGRSRRAPGPYTVQAFADDLADLIGALDLDPVALIGHSMGGAVAQRFAIDHPEAVEALILVAPIPAGGSPYKPAVEDFFRTTVGNPNVTSGWLAKLTVRELDPATAALLRAAAASVADEAAYEMLESWLRLDFADEAATIETPTLVVAPERDPPMTPDFLQRNVADLIAGSRLEVVAESGHYLPVEHPQRLAGLIEAFVAQLAEVE